MVWSLQVTHGNGPGASEFVSRVYSSHGAVWLLTFEEAWYNTSSKVSSARLIPPPSLTKKVYLLSDLAHGRHQGRRRFFLLRELQ
jgi:hypothetical protein